MLNVIELYTWNGKFYVMYILTHNTYTKYIETENKS
jgi:hypothetical protein